MVDVLLVNPPFQGAVRGVAQVSVGPPLGLACLAAVLERHDIGVAVLDANALGLDEAATVRRILQADPRLVGLTATTPTIDLCGRIATAVRRMRADVRLVVGGVHATVLPRETLAAWPAFDFVVAGEGEPVLPALARAVLERRVPPDLPGLWRRLQGGGVTGGGTAQVPDLDALPWPARHLLPMTRYRTVDAWRFTTVLAQRGCPAACTYCAVPQHMGRLVRRRHPADVAAEIAACHLDYGTDFVGFLDDTMTMDRGWVRALCRELHLRHLPGRVRWSCLTRANAVDAALLAEMASAGCVRVELGIETASPRLLQQIRKGVSVDAVRRAFADARQLGIQTMGFVMLGIPGETAAETAATEALVGELDPDLLQLSFATPYPGTPLQADCERQGLALDPDWQRYGFLQRPVLANPAQPPGAAEAARRRIHRRHYLRPRWALRQAARVLHGQADVRALAWAMGLGLRRLLAESLG